MIARLEILHDALAAAGLDGEITLSRQGSCSWCARWQRRGHAPTLACATSLEAALDGLVEGLERRCLAEARATLADSTSDPADAVALMRAVDESHLEVGA
jgi:hypothetical protein